jgi:bacillithiol biosynthesis cysteine-adding enzyme BshC
MFTKQLLPFSTTGSLNKLVSDYLLKKKEVVPLYTNFPNKEGYDTAINAQGLYANLDRKLLVNSLSQQAITVNNTSDQTLNNINLLLNQNTFTVTTGHQLCLFTGPMYFIYKILSVINQCEWLSMQYPNKQFVPVYWMASEDHDFEEIDHAYVFGKKITWSSTQTGAVGDFKTEGIEAAIEDLKQIIGENENTTQLLQVFSKAYNEFKNLSEATRYIVNELFGKYGLVVVDGNNAELKQTFRSVILKDLKENIPFKKVSETIDYLHKHNYTAQVNPREINCFYMEDQKRNRIEKQNDQYKVVNTDHFFSEKEIEHIVDTDIAKISLNVVLRPLYQQHILPNIAYVGGPGELHYWLQYKTMFDEFNIHFPILQPRHFVMLLDKGVQQKITKLELTTDTFFKNEKEIIDTLAITKGSVIELKKEKEGLQLYFDELTAKATSIDKTLESSVKAEAQKALNGLAAIEAKLNKALKQRLETEINQIKTIRTKLFPENIPQERFDNVSMYISKYGMKFIDELKIALGENELSYLILKEN